MRLFVDNLPTDVAETDLIESFSRYGSVEKVDIKRKRDVGDDPRTFAFVSLDGDRGQIGRCLDDFSRTKWNDRFVIVTIAKENFLDRLKRERSELAMQNSQRESNSHVNEQNQNAIESTEIYSKNKQLDVKIQPKNRTKNQSLEDDSELNTLKDNYSCRVSHKYENNGAIGSNGVSLSDKKRLESMHNMRIIYNEKKKQVQMALSALDKKSNNKIIFEDENDSLTNSTLDTMKPQDSFSHKCEISKRKAESNKRKRDIFDEASDDDVSDNDNYNFDLKPHFHGESGKKLLELQSRYQLDKRFILDERFLEDTDNLKEDEVVDVIEPVEDDEKNKQIEILESIIGTSVVHKDLKSTKKKQPMKSMLRYDPTRLDHSKFVDSQKTEIENSSKKKKKQKFEQKIETSQNIPEKNVPDIIPERYYKIEDSLKQSMEDKTPVSLLTLFGKSDSKEKHDEEYHAETLEKKKKVKNVLDKSGNPFFYDSSDSDDNNSGTENKGVETRDNNFLLNEENKSIWTVENLFFSNDDNRLYDGLNFFMNSSSAVNESREKLKHIIKKRIRNNTRNEKFNSAKLKNKTFSSKKNKKIERIKR